MVHPLVYFLTSRSRLHLAAVLQARAHEQQRGVQASRRFFGAIRPLCCFRIQFSASGTSTRPHAASEQRSPPRTLKPRDADLRRDCESSHPDGDATVHVEQYQANRVGSSAGALDWLSSGASNVKGGRRISTTKKMRRRVGGKASTCMLHVYPRYKSQLRSWRSHG